MAVLLASLSYEAGSLSLSDRPSVLLARTLSRVSHSSQSAGREPQGPRANGPMGKGAPPRPPASAQAQACFPTPAHPRSGEDSPGQAGPVGRRAGAGGGAGSRRPQGPRVDCGGFRRRGALEGVGARALADGLLPLGRAELSTLAWRSAPC